MQLSSSLNMVPSNAIYCTPTFCFWVSVWVTAGWYTCSSHAGVTIPQTFSGSAGLELPELELPDPELELELPEFEGLDAGLSTLLELEEPEGLESPLLEPEDGFESFLLEPEPEGFDAGLDSFLFEPELGPELGLEDGFESLLLARRPAGRSPCSAWRRVPSRYRRSGSRASPR